MFVGGFTINTNMKNHNRVRETFKNFPNSYLMIVDHSPYTHNKNSSFTDGYGYDRSVKYAYYIGKQLAQMLVELYRQGISPKTIHCFGFSLGSQILGHVGENFINATGQKISRITALDPAGPCFSDSLIQEQIRAGVAEYVEVYHCNAGALGTSSVLGDADFFVNRGNSQPNCGKMMAPFVHKTLKPSVFAKCSHSTCLKMWLASVANPTWYPAYKCDKYSDFNKNKCSKNDRTTAGFWSSGNATGVYYFSTKRYKFEN